GQEVYQQPYRMQFDQSEESKEYFSQRLNVPPRVESSMDFDSDFARVLVLLLSEGKTVAEMAALTPATEDYVRQTLDSLVSRKYLVVDGSGWKTTFPMIPTDQTDQVLSVSNGISDKLAKKIAANLETYPQALQSLIAEGIVNADSNDFMSGSAVLHRRFPVVGGLLLWHDLGKQFISGGSDLFIFQQSDPCNSHIPNYMYMVQGDREMAGNHYYYLGINRGQLVIHFADSEPRIDCAQEYWTLKRALVANRDWNYPPESKPEFFMLDTLAAKSCLAHLGDGTEPILRQATADLEQLAAGQGQNALHRGYRYWFWNLIATQTLDKLTKSSSLNRRGDGFYQFQVVARK
ncbi:MAG: hypothetical protein V3T31_02990, partial [candidate division Zixibacteria bacterium]